MVEPLRVLRVVVEPSNGIAAGVAVRQAPCQEHTLPVEAQVLVQPFQPAFGVVQLVPELVEVDPDLGIGCPRCPCPLADVLRAVVVLDRVFDLHRLRQDQYVELAAVDGLVRVLVAGVRVLDLEAVDRNVRFPVRPQRGAPSQLRAVVVACTGHLLQHHGDVLVDQAVADVEDAQRLVRRRQRLRVQGREFDRVERLVPSAGGECEGQQVFQRVFQHHVVEARVEEGDAV